MKIQEFVADKELDGQATATNYQTFPQHSNGNGLKSSDPFDVKVYSANGSKRLTKSSLRDFLTVFALSLHAVFEGLAVGIEEEAEHVWILFAGTNYFFKFGPL